MGREPTGRIETLSALPPWLFEIQDLPVREGEKPIWGRQLQRMLLDVEWRLEEPPPRGRLEEIADHIYARGRSHRGLVHLEWIFGAPTGPPTHRFFNRKALSD